MGQALDGLLQRKHPPMAANALHQGFEPFDIGFSRTHRIRLWQHPVKDEDIQSMPRNRPQQSVEQPGHHTALPA